MGIAAYIPQLLYSFSLFVVILTLFYKSEIGIYYLVFLLPLQTLLDGMIEFPLGKDIMDVLVGVILIRWLFEKKSNGEPFLEKNPLNLPIILYISWAFLMLWFGSVNLGLPLPLSISDVRLMEWKKLVIMFLIFFAVVNNIKSRRQINYLILVIALSLFASAFRSFQLSAEVRHLSYFSYSHRAAGTFTYLNANALGAYLAQYSIFFGALILVYKDVKWQRLLFAITAALGTYTMLFTFSRGAYLAMVVGIVFIAVMKSRILLIPIFAFLLSWSYILPSSVVNRVNMTFNKDGELESSASTRLGLWEQAEPHIKSHPITGTGFDTVPYMNFKSKYGLGKGGIAYSLHNSYMQTLVETGVIGLLLILWIHFSAMFHGWKIYRRSKDNLYRGLGLGLVVCALAILANNFTSDNFRFMNIMGFYWAILGVVTRIYLMPEDVPQQQSEKVKPQFRHRELTNKNFSKLNYLAMEGEK